LVLPENDWAAQIAKDTRTTTKTCIVPLCTAP